VHKFWAVLIRESCDYDAQSTNWPTCIVFIVDVQEDEHEASSRPRHD